MWSMTSWFLPCCSRSSLQCNFWMLYGWFWLLTQQRNSRPRCDELAKHMIIRNFFPHRSRFSRFCSFTEVNKIFTRFVLKKSTTIQHQVDSGKEDMSTLPRHVGWQASSDRTSKFVLKHKTASVSAWQSRREHAHEQLSSQIQRPLGPSNFDPHIVRLLVDAARFQMLRQFDLEVVENRHVIAIVTRSRVAVDATAVRENAELHGGRYGSDQQVSQTQPCQLKRDPVTEHSHENQPASTVLQFRQITAHLFLQGILLVCCGHPSVEQMNVSAWLHFARNRQNCVKNLQTVVVWRTTKDRTLLWHPNWGKYRDPCCHRYPRKPSRLLSNWSRHGVLLVRLLCAWKVHNNTSRHKWVTHHNTTLDTKTQWTQKNDLTAWVRTWSQTSTVQLLPTHTGVNSAVCSWKWQILESAKKIERDPLKWEKRNGQCLFVDRHDIARGSYLDKRAELVRGNQVFCRLKLHKNSLIGACTQRQTQFYHNGPWYLKLTSLWFNVKKRSIVLKSSLRATRLPCRDRWLAIMYLHVCKKISLIVQQPPQNKPFSHPKTNHLSNTESVVFKELTPRRPVGCALFPLFQIKRRPECTHPASHTER